VHSLSLDNFVGLIIEIMFYLIYCPAVKIRILTNFIFTNTKHLETWGFGGQDNSEETQKAQNTNSEIRSPPNLLLLLDSKVRRKLFLIENYFYDSENLIQNDSLNNIVNGLIRKSSK
jgi:hypothetical protein